MPIVWRDVMSVGDETVDSGHKCFVEIINQFKAAAKESEVDYQKICEILLSLVNYAREYFSYEEKLQLSVHYSFYESHCRAHREILERLAAILVAYAQAHDAERSRVIQDIGSLLKEWPTNHILQDDQRMKPYIIRARGVYDKQLLDR